MTGDANGDYGKAPKPHCGANLSDFLFLLLYLPGFLNVLQWVCITFYIRKRLKKTLFHKRKKRLCVGMNGCSVLLRHVGSWRRPSGHRAGPTLPHSLTSQACLCSCICRLLSSSFWQVRPAGHPTASGLHRVWHPCPFTRHTTMAFALKSQGSLTICSCGQQVAEENDIPSCKTGV